jgi:hypothetical protein
MLKQQQVLVRLPDDLASRFAQLVAPRQRSRYLIDLLRRDLDRESGELVQAANRLTELEAKDPALATESNDWLNNPLVSDIDDGFEAEVFVRQSEEAQTLNEYKLQQAAPLSARDTVPGKAGDIKAV